MGRIKNTRSRLVNVTFFLLLVGSLPVGSYMYSKMAGAVQGSDIVIINPYKNYEINGKVVAYKGNLHAHSNYGPGKPESDTNDDGHMTSTDVANWYKSNGYDFYALTGHYRPYSYKTGKSPGPEKIKMTITPDPKVDGIVWMGNSMEDHLNTLGDRATCVHAGMINMSSDMYKKEDVSGKNVMVGKTSIMSDLNVQNTINAVNDGGGITILNHPFYNNEGCGSAKAYDAAEKLDNFTGVEVYNSGMGGDKSGTTTYHSGNASNPRGEKGNIYSKKLISPWDKMLLDDKKVWGFGDDDGHGLYSSTNGIRRGLSFNIINSNKAASKNNILDNIKAGNFYASTPTYKGHVEAGGKNYKAPSGFYNLKVTSSANVITISTTNGSSMRRVIGLKDGSISEETEPYTTYIYTVSGQEKYIRFEILDSAANEVAWSQPIYIAVRPSVGFASSTTSVSSTRRVALSGQSTDVSDVLGVSASSVIGEKVSMKLVYRQIEDKNGSSIKSDWHNFGCKTSSSPDGLKGESSESEPLYSCKIAQANGKSDRGWTDRNKNGAMDYVASGSIEQFPGGSTKLKLSAGTYEFAAQSATSSAPNTNIYSEWVTGYKVVITDSITKPLQPVVKLSLSGNNAIITMTAVSCNASASAQYRTRSSFNDGAWSDWSGWSTSKTKTTPASIGYKNNFSIQARCGSFESDITYSSIATYTNLDNPRKMKVRTATYKMNPLSGKNIGTQINVGTLLDFKTKIMIKGQSYLRTTTDSASNIDLVIPFSSLSEV